MVLVFPTVQASPMTSVAGQQAASVVSTGATSGNVMVSAPPGTSVVFGQSSGNVMVSAPPASFQAKNTSQMMYPPPEGVFMVATPGDMYVCMCSGRCECGYGVGPCGRKNCWNRECGCYDWRESCRHKWRKKGKHHRRHRHRHHHKRCHRDHGYCGCMRYDCEMCFPAMMPYGMDPYGVPMMDPYNMMYPYGMPEMDPCAYGMPMVDPCGYDGWDGWCRRGRKCRRKWCDGGRGCYYYFDDSHCSSSSGTNCSSSSMSSMSISEPSGFSTSIRSCSSSSSSSSSSDCLEKEKKKKKKHHHHHRKKKVKW